MSCALYLLYHPPSLARGGLPSSSYNPLSTPYILAHTFSPIFLPETFDYSLNMMSRHEVDGASGNARGVGKVLVTYWRRQFLKPSPKTKNTPEKASAFLDIVGRSIDIAKALKAASPIIPVPWIGSAVDVVVKLLEVVQVRASWQMNEVFSTDPFRSTQKRTERTYDFWPRPLLLSSLPSTRSTSKARLTKATRQSSNRTVTKPQSASLRIINEYLQRIMSTFSFQNTSDSSRRYQRSLQRP